MSSARARCLLFVLLTVLSACKRHPSRDAAIPPFLDCQEDFNCLVARARTCAPASVLRREQVDVLGILTPIVTRHEVVGRVRGRCHVRLTRVEPPPPPLSELKEHTRWEVPPEDEEDPPPPTALDERSPPRMQCLYRGAHAAEALQRLAWGTPSPEDSEPCYPGDGRCGRVPSLKIGCVLGDCLLGRWTYTCETPNHRDIYPCEGTRRSDASPRDQICQSFCGPDEKEQLACRPRPPDMPPGTRLWKAWPSVATP
jgi:hypothetical protein